MAATTTDKTSLQIKDLRNDHDYCFLLAFYIDDNLRWNWTDRSAVRLNIKNERFTVACSSCRSSLKSENFVLLFGRLRQRILLMCVPYVQHDYFSSFIQSESCFLPLLLPLPLLSSLHKSPNLFIGGSSDNGDDDIKWQWRCCCLFKPEVLGQTKIEHQWLRKLKK